MCSATPSRSKWAFPDLVLNRFSGAAPIAPKNLVCVCTKYSHYVTCPQVTLGFYHSSPGVSFGMQRVYFLRVKHSARGTPPVFPAPPPWPCLTPSLNPMSPLCPSPAVGLANFTLVYQQFPPLAINPTLPATLQPKIWHQLHLAVPSPKLIFQVFVQNPIFTITFTSVAFGCPITKADFPCPYSSPGLFPTCVQLHYNWHFKN